jgi:hypothetical protein
MREREREREQKTKQKSDYRLEVLDGEALFSGAGVGYWACNDVDDER